MKTISYRGTIKILDPKFRELRDYSSSGKGFGVRSYRACVEHACVLGEIIE